MFYEFELGHKAAEASKNICCAWGESALDHTRVMKWFKKFCSGCKKTIDSKAALQVMETIPASNSWSVSSVIGLLHFRVLRHLHNIVKRIQNNLIVFQVTKILKNFWLD